MKGFEKYNYKNRYMYRIKKKKKNQRTRTLAIIDFIRQHTYMCMLREYNLFFEQLV